jgi:hypothetical protein
MNPDRYIRNILEPFFEQVTDDERQYDYFQQDSFTAYTARNSTSAQQEVFGIVASARLSCYNLYL